MTTFHGPWPALVTPYTADSAVNHDALGTLTDYLLDKGVTGFYVCGATGQGTAMAVAEREQVAETVIEQVSGRVPVVIHIGAMAAPDAVTLAAHAQRAGADGIASIVPPLYRTTAPLVAYFGQLAVAAPGLPLLAYLYGGPSDAVALMEALMTVPTVAGAKYTGPNMHEFQQLVTLRPDWSIFSGMDEQCLFAAMCGACGNIGSTLNFIPGAYREIHRAWQAGEAARALELQTQANQVTAVLQRFGFVGALREVMRLLEIEVGPPRLPGLPLSAEQAAALREALKTTPFARLVAL